MKSSLKGSQKQVLQKYYKTGQEHRGSTFMEQQKNIREKQF